MANGLVRDHERPLVRQADSDEQAIGLWLRGFQSSRTRQAYDAALRRWRRSCDLPLDQVRLVELQDFADSLTNLAPASQAAILSALKSLFTFAHRIGYLRFNVAAAVRLPKVPQRLTERILTEEATLVLVTRETDPRKRAMLRLLYGGGLRVSELCALSWRDLQARDQGDGQATIFGKGGKTRAVRLSATTWSEVSALRGDVGPEAPVFATRTGRPLTRVQVWRIVKAAARRAGVDAASPHWLRHAHCSHALDRGAPLAVVRDTVGHGSIATTNKYAHARPGESSARYLAV